MKVLQKYFISLVLATIAFIFWFNFEFKIFAMTRKKSIIHQCQIPKIEILNCLAELKCLPVPRLNCSGPVRLADSVTVDANGRKRFAIDAVQTNFSDLNCCYFVIYRNENISRPDFSYESSQCVPFGDSFEIKHEFYVIKCYQGTNLVYAKGFASVDHNENIKRKKMAAAAAAATKTSDTNPHPIKILIVGIDSVSNAHFKRALPDLNSYLASKNWIEFAKYHKVGRNTLPNLSSMLTGKRENSFDPRSEKYEFIWERFSRNNFLTAFFEDEVEISTFNLQSNGFEKQPTDFYGRNYVQALEVLLPIKKDGVVMCTGFQNSCNLVLENSKNFALSAKNNSAFGLFWINGVTHHDANYLYDYEPDLLRYIDDLERLHITDEFIVFLLSDHGTRSGPVRQSESGFLEDSLPFLRVSIPNWFAASYPAFYQSLLANRDTLATPFDLYMTLQHLLRLSNRTEPIRPSATCSQCHSLFYRLDPDRVCDQCAIPDVYCTCQNFQYLNERQASESDVKRLIRMLIDSINEQMVGFIADRNCAKLHAVNHTRVYASDDLGPRKKYVVKFTTMPGNGQFEASVVSDRKSLHDIDLNRSVYEITRLDSYRKLSSCIKDSPKKFHQYCICVNQL